MLHVTKRQSTKARKMGLSAPPPGRYQAVHDPTTRTTRYRNVATGETISRRKIDNARHAASYESRAKAQATPDTESPMKRYYRAVRRAREHDPTLTLSQARHRVSQRRISGFNHFVSSYAQRHNTSRAKAEHEVRKALAVLDRKRSAQSDRDRTRALRTIGRIGEDEFYQNDVLLTTGFEHT
jgi:hypothetical protein